MLVNHLSLWFMCRRKSHDDGFRWDEDVHNVVAGHS